MVEKIVKEWCKSNRLDWKKISYHNLKVKWSSELAQDITSMGGIDAEGELIRMVCEEINKEINFKIVNTTNEFLQELDKQGYKIGDIVTYNPTNFTPYRNIETKLE